MGAHTPIANGAAVEVNNYAEEKPPAVSSQALSTTAKTASKKPRIDCIDGCRFALVFPIIVGHFVRFGTKSELLLKLLTQENVLVGGFFIISGYVSGYVATNMGERKADEKKLKDPELFFWQKVMSYYPLHFLISTSFAPLFIQVDRWVNLPWSTTRFHAFLNYTLMQAWFSSEAEIWNPPTWFLSALTIANALMPSVLTSVASLSKHGLRNLLRGLTVISMLQKLSYSQGKQYFSNVGISAKKTSNLWNLTRFHPIGALVEITMGIASVREVMLDDAVERSKPVMNPAWLFLASYGTLALRCTRLDLNDAIIRSALFVPLYSRFLTAMHRDCMTERPSAITRFFGSKTMVWLGSLAFPMFMIHGPLGQLFYKKAVAMRLWGKVMPQKFFPIYLLLVLLSGQVLNEGFVKKRSCSACLLEPLRFWRSTPEACCRTLWWTRS